MEVLSMFISADHMVYSFIGNLSLILLGVGLMCLGEALWITLKMRDEGGLP